LHLRQFHLEFGFVRLGPGGEDIEDELGAIQHLDPFADFRAGGFIDDLFERADLSRRKVVIEYDDVGALLFRQMGNFGGFARADVGPGIRTTLAPAVLARDANSPSGSRGSAVDPGKMTPTKTAFSCRTDSSVRFSSANDEPFPMDETEYAKNAVVTRLTDRVRASPTFGMRWFMVWACAHAVENVSRPSPFRPVFEALPCHGSMIDYASPAVFIGVD
jgi:hypothetical protein